MYEAWRLSAGGTNREGACMLVTNYTSMNLSGNRTHIVLNTMSKVMLFRLAAHIKSAWWCTLVFYSCSR